MPYYSGSFENNGSIAYVEQEPIIFSTTIKENILFGHTFEENMYKTVLNLSCLNDDLSLF